MNAEACDSVSWGTGFCKKRGQDIVTYIIRYCKSDGVQQCQREQGAF